MDWLIPLALIVLVWAIAFEDDLFEFEHTIEWCLSHPIKTARNIKKNMKGVCK